MQTIRRLYVYGVSFVSLEVVLWGVIGLARSIFSSDEIGGGVSRLAGALSLILVGIPVFSLHWWLAQNSAYQDLEERSSRVRAFFLYGTLLATLVPVVQNVLALVNRMLIGFFGVSSQLALLGGGQTTVDNLIAMAANGIMAGYIFSILMSDWAASPLGDAFAEVRRMYRYAWLIYSLAIVILGVQQTLEFILAVLPSIGDAPLALLANGLALVLAGTPLWIFIETLIQRSLAQDTEGQSLLRLVVLYILAFVSVGSALVSGGLVLNEVLRAVFGARVLTVEFLGQIARPLSVALPFGVVWAYYGRALTKAIMAVPEPVYPGEIARRYEPGGNSTRGETTLRRASLRRMYFYVLALLGLGATFAGLQLLLAFNVDSLIGAGAINSDFLQNQLAAALSTLAVGLPLWTFAWRSMSDEAAKDGEAGDHARRSVVRKGYLYLVLFVGVMGTMFSAGVLLFQLLRNLLGDVQENPRLEILQQFRVLVLFALLLAYHWDVLRNDSRKASRSLARRHALFPVLVLAPDESETEGDNALPRRESFAAVVANALQREAPALPVAVHHFSQGAPDESLSTARAVVLPGELMLRPSEAMRLWLQAFVGPRVVIPTNAKGWHWVSGSGRSLSSLAGQAAQTVRMLAEGEEITPARQISPFQILVYVLAGLFILQVVLGVIGIGASLLLR